MGTPRKILLAFIVLMVAVAGGVYWQYTRTYVTTDDAYVGANVVRIGAQVQAPVSAVLVSSYQFVKQGDTLLRLNPQPFQLAVQRAEIQLQQAMEAVGASTAGLGAAESLVDEREAELQDAQRNRDRILTLVADGMLPVSQADDARTRAAAAAAQLSAARAQLEQARRALGVTGAGNAQLRAAETALSQARLQLSYTTVEAPTDGIVGDVTIRPGTIVANGGALFPLVDTSKWWVDANFKETDLARARVGQHARIQVDIYPGVTLDGVVESLSPASGAAFSLLPPENATGNWVKVTQRFPVRIRVTGAAAHSHDLRIGASCTVRIDTTQKVDDTK